VRDAREEMRAAAAPPIARPEDGVRAGLGGTSAFELWTLPTDGALPMAEVRRRLAGHAAAARLPAALFPDDLAPAPER
jgi:hypothetical protein